MRGKPQILLAVIISALATTAILYGQPTTSPPPRVPTVSAIIYVSKDAAASDARTGLSDYDPAHPFASIGAAITAASAGDTVVVLPGTYAEDVTAADGVNLYGYPGTTISSAAGTALSVPTGVSCLITGAFDFVAGTSSTSPVVSLTGTGSVVLMANSALHQAVSVTTNESGVYTTKTTAYIRLAEESRSTAYDGVWINGGDDVRVEMPFAVGGDNGVEVTGGANVRLAVAKIHAANSAVQIGDGYGSLANLAVLVQGANITSTSGSAVAIVPSSESYESVIVQGCVLATEALNNSPDVNIVHGGGVSGRIVLRDCSLLDISGATASESIVSNAPIALDGVTVDLPLDAGITWTGSYIDENGVLQASGLGTAAYVDTGTGGSDVPTVSDADTLYVNATGTETVAGDKTFSGLTTLSGGINGRLVMRGVDAPNPSGLSETQIQMYRESSGQFAHLLFYLHGAPANAKFWDYFTDSSSGAFQVRAVNDAFSVGTAALTITRSGATPLVADFDVVLRARGTATNDNAAPGDIGEVLTSTVAVGSAVSLTTDTPANVTSISLTAGDWDISGTVYYAHGGSTTATYYTAGIGATSATLPGYAGAQASIPGTGATITGYTPSVALAPTRVSLSSTTTYYLVAQSSFADTLAAYGHLRARRPR